MGQVRKNDTSHTIDKISILHAGAEAALIALCRFDGSTSLPDFKLAAEEVRDLLRDRSHEKINEAINEANKQSQATARG
jgi:hypothetical protein